MKIFSRNFVVEVLVDEVKTTYVVREMLLNQPPVLVAVCPDSQSLKDLFDKGIENIVSHV